MLSAVTINAATNPKQDRRTFHQRTTDGCSYKTLFAPTMNTKRSTFFLRGSSVRMNHSAGGTGFEAIGSTLLFLPSMTMIASQKQVVRLKPCAVQNLESCVYCAMKLFAV